MIEWMGSQFLRACADCSRWTQNLLLESRSVRYTPSHRRLGITAGTNVPRSCVYFPLFSVFLWALSVVKQRRPEESTEDVLRVKMYESFTRVTIFLPDDFHGVVQRLGHSGRSISCSRAALYLKESDNLRFTGAVDGTEDQVLVRTEKILHVCVAGHDAPVARTGRFRRNSH